jgi:hypothetical protein
MKGGLCMAMGLKVGGLNLSNLDEYSLILRCRGERDDGSAFFNMVLFNTHEAIKIKKLVKITTHCKCVPI